MSIDPRVLLTVCNAGLQAHVQVRVRDGGGGSTHGLEGHVDGLHAVGAHLQALQVCGSLDGVLGVGELTVAACIAQVDDDGAGLALGLSAHLLCQLALQQSGDLCAGVGQEGQGEHQQTGAEVELATGKPPRACLLAGQHVYSIHSVLLSQQKTHIFTRAIFTELIAVSLCIWHNNRRFSVFIQHFSGIFN